MKKNHFFRTVFLFSFLSISIFYSCSKGGGTTTPPADPCTNITIITTGNAVAADAGVSNGSITASATGTTGAFTFSINNGPFQTSGTFNNLAAGKYNITAKSVNGCTGLTSVTVVAKANGCTGTAGPLFTAVKTILTTNCAVTGCHNGTQSPNYTVDCTIVDYSTLIKTRAVDQAGTADQMPQPPRMALAQGDRDKITAWVAAGGRLTD